MSKDGRNPLDILNQDLAFTDIQLTPIHKSSVLDQRAGRIKHCVLFNHRIEKELMSDADAQATIEWMDKKRPGQKLETEDFLVDRHIGSGLSHRDFTALVERELRHLVQDHLAAVSEVALPDGQVFEGVLTVDINSNYLNKFSQTTTFNNRFRVHEFDSVQERDSFLKTREILKQMGVHEKGIEQPYLDA